MFYGTRSFRFEIAKRNQEVTGDHTEVWYDGRNCELLVTIGGTRNPRSEMILDLGQLDFCVDQFLKKYDHTTIDYPFYRLVERLWGSIRGEFRLARRIRLYETDKIWYDLGDNDFMDITKTYQFSAAHKTLNIKLSQEENDALYGKCMVLHGHMYDLDVTIRCDKKHLETSYADEQDVMDDLVHKVIKDYDNEVLNEKEGLENATTENFIKVLWNRLSRSLNNHRWGILHKLKLRETARNYFEYYGEE